MIRYRHFAPKQYKCLYCGYSPLEIWAFVWIDYRTRREKSTPVMVCSDAKGRAGCGTFFDPAEFNLTPRHRDLVIK